MPIVNHEDMSTTAGRFSRQVAEHRMAHPGAFALFCNLAGGPLDAPDFIAAGACDSTAFRSGLGRPLAHPSLVMRESV